MDDTSKNNTEARVRAVCENAVSLSMMQADVFKQIIKPRLIQLYEVGIVGMISNMDSDTQMIRSWNTIALGSFSDPHEEEILAYEWIVFANLISEVMSTENPELMLRNQDRILHGFGDDQNFRQQTEDLFVKVVVPLIDVGNIPAVISDSTLCKRTGQFIKFGLDGFRPIIKDQNDNDLLFDHYIPTRDEGDLPRP